MRQVIGFALLSLTLSLGSSPTPQAQGTPVVPTVPLATPLEMRIAIAPPNPLSSSDIPLFQDITQSIAPQPLGNLLQSIAQKFLGTPYTAGLLDRSPQEELIINLQEFDCVLFVETVLALARTSLDDRTPQTFAQHIEAQRYRNGQMDGYCSRLHYFSDWILDNQSKGIVTDLTFQLGGMPLNKTIDFMSTYRSSYPQLADESNYQCIVNRENTLSQQTIYYIPTDRITEIYADLQPGDIIAIATAVPGLDVTHTGLVYQTAEQTGLIHAAPGGVRISADLESYVAQVEMAIGIMVARPGSPQ
jgi:cell wall-associated NlpC family hydrolase